MEKTKLPTLNQQTITSLKEKALREIKNEPLFKEFIIKHQISDEEIKDNASKFIKVRDDKAKCNGCKGKCIKKMAQTQLELVFDDEKRTAEIKFVICHYYAKINLLKMNYLYLDFPLEYLEYDFSKELISNDYRLVRKKLITKLVNILNTNSSKGLFVYGDNRIGKTFILSLFSMKYIEKTKKSVAFCSSKDLFQTIQDSLFNDKERAKEYINQLIDVDLLILDGFGNEYKSDYVRDTIVYPLLSARLEKHKLTMFTSNFSIEEIEEMYDTSKSSKPRARQLKKVLTSLSEEILLEGRPYPI